MEADESGDVDLDGMDGLNGLPNEVLFLILEQLDLDSLLICHDVCQSWRKYALVETTLLPHVLHAYAGLTHGTRPLPAGAGASQMIERLKELFRTSVSALPVFAECTTFRDIAANLRRLERSWLSGGNAGFASLNHGDIHETPLVSVAVDAKAGGIITGDDAGVVAFWDAATGVCRHKGGFQLSDGQWVIPLHLVVEGDLLVIGTMTGGVIVTARNQYGGLEPFVRVTEFWPNSGHVASIRMEGYVCIVGEIDAVSFWDLSRFVDPCWQHAQELNTYVPTLMTIDTRNDSTPLDSSPNYTLFYRNGLLFGGLNGSRIQQIASHASPEMPVRKELWEPPGDSHYAVLVSGPETNASPEGMGISELCPIGSDGDILVSWADSSIYRLSSNMAPGQDFVWEPRSEFLVPSDIEMFSAQGVPIGSMPCRYGDISCMAIDPSFIVVGTDRAAVCVYYFASGHPTPIHGQGPSSSAAATAASAVPSPSLETKNTYKRKFMEAMGPDIPQSFVGPSAPDLSDVDFDLRVAKSAPRSISSPLLRGSKQGRKIPVSAP
ncbi:hypothetical protein ABW21_db0200605 [Orbilia brochopaga]|nr:hypothetical protein ABW21_db0200605 [Drechslerella brochopaga]